MGKSGANVAKTGAQKAEQALDDLLPYHPKHQVALVGPVPYNVFNGEFFVERLVMMAERLPGSLGGMNAGKSIKTVKYDTRVLKRMTEDTGPYHNFPTYFDKLMLSNKPVMIRPDGRAEFLYSGTINGQPGYYHITYKNEMIVHRSFIPQSDWKRYANRWELPFQITDK